MLSRVEEHHHGKNQLCFNVFFYHKSSCLTDSGAFCLSKARLGWKRHHLAWGSFISPPWFSGTQQHALGKLNLTKTYPSSTKHQVSRCTRRCDLHCFPQPFAQPVSAPEASRNHKMRRQGIIQTRNAVLHSAPVHHMPATELSSSRAVHLLMQW